MASRALSRGSRVWLLAACLSAIAACSGSESSPSAQSLEHDRIMAARRPDTDYDRLFPYELGFEPWLAALGLACAAAMADHSALP